MTPGQFTAFLSTAFCLFSKHSSAGSLHYCCMDWRHMSEVLAAGDLAYSEMMNLCVWSLHVSFAHCQVQRRGCRLSFYSIERGTPGRMRRFRDLTFFGVWRPAAPKEFPDEDAAWIDGLDRQALLRALQTILDSRPVFREWL
jgi:hypothetical protein